MQVVPFSSEPVLQALEKVLCSKAFAGSERSSRLLRFVVEAAVNGQADRLKEYTLGAEALGRGAAFDPRIDSIARVEVSRLRNRLEQYYATEGREDAVVIVLPRGTYVPVFESPAAAPEQKTPAATTAGRLSRGLIWFAGGVVTVALGLALLGRSPWRAPRDVNRPLLQFDVQLTPGGLRGAMVGSDIALAPNGRSLVFAEYLASGRTRLASRRLDEREVVELPGTEQARAPFVSPDGEWVAFWAGGKLKKTPARGGSPINLCDATDLLGGSWGDDDNIIATLDSTGRLMRIPSGGGLPAVILDLARESLVPRWPQVLPGAKGVLFTSMGLFGPDGGNIEVLSLADGRRKTLIRGGTYGRYLPQGVLLYVNQGTLYAARFDLDRLELSGGSVAVLQDVAYSSVWGFAQLDVSRDGTFVYRRDPAGGQVVMQWLDTNGELAPLLDKPGRYQMPRLAPNGKRVAFSVSEGGGSSNIWVSEQAPNRITPLTSGDGIHMDAVWTPDGRYIVYEGAKGMWYVRTDGASRPQPLTGSSSQQMPWAFTSDGKRLAYSENNPATGYDIWTVPIQAGRDGIRAGKPEAFLATPGFELYPAFSPDGRWIAYGSNKSGSWEIYVRAFPDTQGETQISSGGGRVPRWPTNSRQIFYGTDDQRIMAVPYSIEGASLKFGSARRISELHLANTGVLPNFDLGPDGTRIIALRPPETQPEEPANEVTFLLNFSNEVRRRMAASRDAISAGQ